MYLFVTESLLCFFGNFLSGFGVLTVSYDISRLIFLLFVLLWAHYWVHHGIICFEVCWLFWFFLGGGVGTTVSSNTAWLFCLQELLKYMLNLPSSSVSWTLCCALPSFEENVFLRISHLLSSLPNCAQCIALCIHSFPLAFSPFFCKTPTFSSQIAYVPFRVPCTLRLLLTFLIKTLL